MAKKKRRKVNFVALIKLLCVVGIVGGIGTVIVLNFDKIKGNIENSSIKEVIKKENKIEVKEFEILSGKVYLAPNGKFTMRYNISTSDDEKAKISFKCEDENICTVTDEGIITAGSVGNTKVVVKVEDQEKKLDVLVTDLIELKPAKYDVKKKLLTCQRYTDEENALLDEILAARINEAGYHTRAGVVAAARFWLEFPYRIAYFSENGRLYNPEGRKYVDGEGRYYHKGLYLSSSKYSELKPKGIYRGPKEWGCKMYSDPSEGQVANGFDCSGFITWIVYNGGYDCEDIGAGITSVKDMTDLGTKIRTGKSLASNSIKTGDLLAQLSYGDHIALVAGQDENYFYVAESLWGRRSMKGDFGAVISTYKRSELEKYFYWHIDMDEYYGEDGNLTDMWEIER